MKSTLQIIAEKHNDWIRIVESFGCNSETSEDVVQEMYLKINTTLSKGTNIMYNETEINHFYIFRTLRTMFLDLIRKEKKVVLIDIEKAQLPPAPNEVNFSTEYNKFLNNLDNFHWYDKKVFEYIEAGESIASLSEKTKISYYSLYNTYRRVKQTLLEKI
tara:strand:+ start:1732 stop:2211 length:480 start_codon:yes stop_codon:yes gene_type:complete